MARCRRNVDNFLEACRRIGVDEVCISWSYPIKSLIISQVSWELFMISFGYGAIQMLL